jgi:hypothetical protein
VLEPMVILHSNTILIFDRLQVFVMIYFMVLLFFTSLYWAIVNKNKISRACSIHGKHCVAKCRLLNQILC